MPHLRCAAHCPQGGGFGFVGMAAAVAVAVYVLWQAAVILAVAAGTAAVVVAALAVASKVLARRLSVVTWPVPAAVPPRVVARAALTEGPRMLEAPPPQVYVITDVTSERMSR